MEAASEKKRGRGRPPRFSAELMRRAAADGPRSRHGQQDRIYAQLAIAEIKNKYPEPDERTRWLFDEEKMTAKWTLLTELGRFAYQHGTDNFYGAVDWLLRTRPKVKDALKKLRTVRLTGSSPPPDTLELKLLKVLEPYPPDRALEALEYVLGFYLQEEGRDRPTS